MNNSEYIKMYSIQVTYNIFILRKTRLMFENDLNVQKLHTENNLSSQTRQIPTSHTAPLLLHSM